MIRTSFEIAYIIVLLAMYHAAITAIGPDTLNELKQFMFGPYIEVYQEHFQGRKLPDFMGAYLLIIAVAFGFMFLRNWYRLSRQGCSLILAIIIFDLIRWNLALAGSERPDPDWLLYGITALGWLFLSGALAEDGFWQWWRDKHEGRL